MSGEPHKRPRDIPSGPPGEPVAEDLWGLKEIEAQSWRPSQRDPSLAYGKGSLLSAAEIALVTSSSGESAAREADRIYRFKMNENRWHRLVAVAKQYSGGYCARCRCLFPLDRLQVHHKHYRNFGRERLEDLEVLCERCHPIADEERRRAIQAIISDHRFQCWLSAGYALYMKEHYGDDWRGAPVAYSPQTYADCEEWHANRRERRELAAEYYSEDDDGGEE